MRVHDTNSSNSKVFQGVHDLISICTRGSIDFVFRPGCLVRFYMMMGATSTGSHLCVYEGVRVSALTLTLSFTFMFFFVFSLVVGTV